MNGGKQPAYRETARRLGKALAARDIELVYGGASVGMMGAVADAVLSAGGKVTGIFPHWISRWEEPHQGLTDLRIVGSMHERKALMAEMSDAVIALPGGLGTLDEVFEMLTWQQMGLHDKPIGFLDVNGFFEHLFRFLDHSVDEGLLRAENRDRAWRDSDPEHLLDRLQGAQPTSADEWSIEYQT